MKIKINIPKLIFSIAICQLAGFIGSIFTSPSIPTWYASLNKPVFNPPSWIFAPVWTTLFFLMGVSLYLVWEKGLKEKKVKIALGFFSAQLLLNVLWSVIFFGLQQPLYAFIEIIILWTAILLTILKFYKISKPAAYLLMPYTLWVGFAAVLNYSLWMIN